MVLKGFSEVEKSFRAEMIKPREERKKEERRVKASEAATSADAASLGLKVLSLSCNEGKAALPESWSRWFRLITVMSAIPVNVQTSALYI